MKNNIEYIIIQAGGLGTRLEYLTHNKPKCLVSVLGKPIIFHTFDIFKKANFIIIADYKKEILKKYLDIFAKGINYQIVSSEEKGTCAGINKALDLIPNEKKFIITWSDLLFSKKPFDSSMIKKNENYIGLSLKFTCRWMFYNDKFYERRSKKYGIAGFFIIKDKKYLNNLPSSGEFVRFLKETKISFRGLKLKNTYEVGTLEKYQKIHKNYPSVRPFNKIIKLKKTIIKKPLDEQGRNIGLYEKNFCKKFEKFNFSFLPKIFKYNPLTLEKINGDSLFRYKDILNKKAILKKIIVSLDTIHASLPKTSSDNMNDYRAIIEKTFDRLNKIKQLIPNFDSDEFVINQKKCLNVFKNLDLIKKTMENFYSNEYVPIHGDLTFSNTLYDPIKDAIYLIDPRGYYGSSKIFGDIDYDWAKIYYSIVGNYDQFNVKKFNLDISDKNIYLNIQSNNWEHLENYFFKLTKTNKNKIKFFHAMIWLALTSYAWDDIDSILGAFYNGTYWLQDFYDKKSL